MNKTSFIDKHPNITSVLGVIVWFAVIALMAMFTGCKAKEYIEIVKTDTLHVYHTDTIREVHNDTIREKVIITIHDSIIKQTTITNVVDQDGNIVHSEKETNNETFHNSVTDTQLIQHTVDSILQAKMDSIYNASHEDKPVIVEKQAPWYKKTWQWIKDRFAYIGVTALIFILLAIFGERITNWLKKWKP